MIDLNKYMPCDVADKAEEEIRESERERVIRLIEFFDRKVAKDVEWVLRRSDEITRN